MGCSLTSIERRSYAVAQKGSPVLRAGRLGTAAVLGHECAGVPAGGAGVDVLAQLVEAQHQPHGRGDLEVGRVRALAADHAFGEQRVDAVELGRQRLQAPAGSLLGRAHLQRDGGSHHRDGLDDDMLGNTEQRAADERRHGLGVLAGCVAGELAHAVLEPVVGPGLGGLDRHAIRFREERRLGHELLQRAGDPHRAGDPAALERHHRHGRAAIPHQRQDHPVRHVRQVDARELDALEAQHQLGADDGMRADDADELRAHQPACTPASATSAMWIAAIVAGCFSERPSTCSARASR